MEKYGGEDNSIAQLDNSIAQLVSIYPSIHPSIQSISLAMICIGDTVVIMSVKALGRVKDGFSTKIGLEPQ